MEVKAERSVSVRWSYLGMRGYLVLCIVWCITELLWGEGCLLCSEGRYATSLDKTPPGNRSLVAHFRLAEAIHMGYNSPNERIVHWKMLIQGLRVSQQD